MVAFRHPSGARIAEIASLFPTRAQALAADDGTTLSLKPALRVPEQPFDADCVALVRATGRELGYSYREMISGAGHDACMWRRYFRAR
jgi:N-carbamoyl-L-amino-acid hydrolase